MLSITSPIPEGGGEGGGASAAALRRGAAFLVGADFFADGLFDAMAATSREYGSCWCSADVDPQVG
jgi:hypothetical protein